MTMEDTSESTDATPETKETDPISDEEQSSSILAPPVEEAGAEPEDPPVVETEEKSLEAEPGAETAEAPAAEELAIEEPAAERPEATTDEPAEEPAAGTPEEPRAEAAEEPQAEAAEEPQAEAAEEPQAEAAEEPEAEPAEEPEPEPAEEPAVAEPAAETTDEPQAEAAEEPAAEEPEEKKPAGKAKAKAKPAGEPDGNGAGADPFRGPGDWYVIHTYAGYENKVKTNLQTRIQTMQMQEKIFDVQIPMEDVMEIKGGKKQVVQKKVFPGYLLVKMVYDDDSWVCVRNTPGVTGFVSSGTGQKPTPLSRREVEKILTVEKEEAKKPAFRLDFEEGDVVRIISGPFADFNGTISDINVAQSKVRVMVNIFDRETPVELSFDQVARV